MYPNQENFYQYPQQFGNAQPMQNPHSQGPYNSAYPQQQFYPQGPSSIRPTIYPQNNFPTNSNAQNQGFSMQPSAYQPGDTNWQMRNIRKGRPTLFPAQNFNANNDADMLRKAMKGSGTDENSIINILCRRSCDQRLAIARAYKTAYGKDLTSEIKSETSGDFEDLLIALLQPTAEFYCTELNDAMSGLSTDEDTLIEIMCTLTNDEIRQVVSTYQRMFGNNLEDDLRSETSGNFKRLLTSLCTAGRDESIITNIVSAKADALALKEAGVDQWGTDESEFNRILCLRNFDQLKLICAEYHKLTGNTLEKDIKEEFSGDIKDALVAIIQVACNRPEYFAKRLHESMAGLGTDDESLIRICVTRCEIDMQDIKEAFQRLYSKSLKVWIDDDTSGHYRNALFALIGETP